MTLSLSICSRGLWKGANTNTSNFQKLKQVQQSAKDAWIIEMKMQGEGPQDMLGSRLCRFRTSKAKAEEGVDEFANIQSMKKRPSRAVRAARGRTGTREDERRTPRTGKQKKISKHSCCSGARGQMIWTACRYSGKSVSSMNTLLTRFLIQELDRYMNSDVSTFTSKRSIGTSVSVAQGEKTNARGVRRVICRIGDR